VSEPLNGDEIEVLERPRLGELLLNAGVITHDVLTRALAEQARTNRPLGRILVDEGHVPAHKIAMALADQHGQPMKTEYGFASGHAAPATAAAAAAPALAPAPAPAPEFPAASEQPAPPAPAPEFPAAFEQPAPPAPAPKPPAAVERTVPAPAPAAAPAASVAPPAPEPRVLVGPLEVYLPAEIVEVNGHRYAVAKLDSAIPSNDEIIAAFAQKTAE